MLGPGEGLGLDCEDCTTVALTFKIQLSQPSWREETGGHMCPSSMAFTLQQSTAPSAKSGSKDLDVSTGINITFLLGGR